MLVVPLLTCATSAWRHCTAQPSLQQFQDYEGLEHALHHRCGNCSGGGGGGWVGGRNPNLDELALHSLHVTLFVIPLLRHNPCLHTVLAGVTSVPPTPNPHIRGNPCTTCALCATFRLNDPGREQDTPFPNALKIRPPQLETPRLSTHAAYPSQVPSRPPN